VKSPTCVGLGPVALEILSYLSAHQDAQDTVEGIAEWWLLEQRIRHVLAEVKKALVELVAHGLLFERMGADGRLRYRLNPRKRAMAARCLKKLRVEPTAASAVAPAGSTADETTRVN